LRWRTTWTTVSSCGGARRTGAMKPRLANGTHRKRSARRWRSIARGSTNGAGHHAPAV